MTASRYSNVDLSALKIPLDLLRLLPVDMMRRHSALPVELKQRKLTVALPNPADQRTIQEIQTVTGYDLDVVPADPDGIAQALDRHLKNLVTAAYCRDLDIKDGAQDIRVSQTVDRLLDLAIAHRASDIHLEPQAAGLYARFRVDGSLLTIHEFPKASAAGLVSRIKIMASMDIAEKRLPQDGQIYVKIQDKEVDLRVSTMPGKHGEKVVLRLLHRSGTMLDLSRLGMGPQVQGQFEMLIEKPQGMILVTGPTGSGKSTTLYAVLNRLRSPFKNIITLEDPIEYDLIGREDHEAGATQIQIHPKIGLTFAAGLRATLRQDPDILMVGEIRDKETAEVAMKAAMTGHLVLSTLHTNSAPETIGRLRDIGVEPYLIASTVMGIMAQRLVRVLCASCKQPYELPERALRSIFPDRASDAKVVLYRQRGCPDCKGTGYWGRRGLYEFLVMNDTLRDHIHGHASSRDIKAAAQAQGMRSLRECGLDLVFQGVTTVDEVFRSTVE